MWCETQASLVEISNVEVGNINSNSKQKRVRKYQKSDDNVRNVVDSQFQLDENWLYWSKKEGENKNTLRRRTSVNNYSHIKDSTWKS